MWVSVGQLPPSKKPKNLRKPQWGEAEKQLVLLIRRENPTYGKEKIAIILQRDYGQTMSQSTVGRILKFLSLKGFIVKSPSALRTKRKRVFKKHARPWEFKDYKTMELGERVQIDHMSVTKNGNATAKSAKRFLLDFVERAPFPILSIQVDGGSEFMAEFEEACAELGMPLIVVPPKKPEYNGGVERGNRTFREEFYNRSDLLDDSVRGMQAALNKALIKYNTYRPHRNLKGLTPMQYINHSYLKAA